MKKLEQELLSKEQENTSLQHKVDMLEATLDKSEAKVMELKGAGEEGDSAKANNESLTRKVQLLEEELDVAEKNVKETVEKCVAQLPHPH